MQPSGGGQPGQVEAQVCNRVVDQAANQVEAQVCNRVVIQVCNQVEAQVNLDKWWPKSTAK